MTPEQMLGKPVIDATGTVIGRVVRTTASPCGDGVSIECEVGHPDDFARVVAAGLGYPFGAPGEVGPVGYNYASAVAELVRSEPAPLFPRRFELEPLPFPRPAIFRNPFGDLYPLWAAKRAVEAKRDGDDDQADTPTVVENPT